MKRAGLLALAALTACSTRPKLEVFGVVPDFALTSQKGEPFRGESLRGKVWVVDFIFTTCTGPCPRMTSQMRQVQTALAGETDVRLVSFTVDPEHDLPPQLDEYAKRQKADPEKWVFLTGAREQLHKLNREVFMLGNVDGSLNHSSRFVVVDRRMRIRGFYDTLEDDIIRRVVEDVRGLLKES